MSLSASPAFAPWGIPLELDPDEADEDVVVDPLPDELVVWAGGVAAFVVVPELEAFEPQAATPSATSTNRTPVSRRVDLLSFVVISSSSV
ncbi:MAG: hypothetical protein JO244_02945 [Solirubrobacterales bacterium]|nr:hypothetical protein [Solirubrobacterales bacterium]